MLRSGVDLLLVMVVSDCLRLVGFMYYERTLLVVGEHGPLNWLALLGSDVECGVPDS